MNQLSLGLGFYFIISLQLPRRQRKKEREGETPSWQISFPARGAGRGGMVLGRLTAVSYKGRSSYKGTSFSIGSCAVLKSKSELSQGWSSESPYGRKALGFPGLVWSHGGAVQALKGSAGRNQAGKTSVPRKKRKAQQTRLFLHPRTSCHWLPQSHTYPFSLHLPLSKDQRAALKTFEASEGMGLFISKDQEVGGERGGEGRWGKPEPGFPEVCPSKVHLIHFE